MTNLSKTLIVAVALAAIATPAFSQAATEMSPGMAMMFRGGKMMSMAMASGPKNHEAMMKGAKKVPNKGALCLRVMKRSGESAGFATRFDTGVLAVWDELSAGVHDLSGRFAYRYVQLLKPLLARTGEDSDSGWEKAWTPDLMEACRAELRHTLIQQGQQKAEKANANAVRWITQLIRSADAPVLSPAGFLHFWMAWAFVNRITQSES